MIADVFLSRGYVLKKSKKTFVKDFETGQEVVCFGFLNTGGLVSVDVSFGISYASLEHLYLNFKRSRKNRLTFIPLAQA